MGQRLAGDVEGVEGTNGGTTALEFGVSRAFNFQRAATNTEGHHELPVGTTFFTFRICFFPAVGGVAFVLRQLMLCGAGRACVVRGRRALRGAGVPRAVC